MIRLLVTLSAAVALVLLTASAAGGAPGFTATVTPNPVPAQGAYTVAGCGYDPGDRAYVTVSGPGPGFGYYAEVVGFADAQGCLSGERTAGGAGTYRVQVLAYHNPSNNKPYLAAELFFEVV